ncbi:hypothetical protein T4D_2833 [Trichinella pseudospiralis]|uniref:Uncharacterized protein n=1 Tax=Trichinella pseudospiralis TaxID=6337 RepID=A0A0V1F6Z7_TRIPS|nr:hypothetical protein T4D_2833 [Trichinella pseudospiralis]
MVDYMHTFTDVHTMDKINLNTESSAEATRLYGIYKQLRGWSRRISDGAQSLMKIKATDTGYRRRDVDHCSWVPEMWERI